MSHIDAAYAVLGGDRDWGVFRAAMRVRCPWCRAQPGTACTSIGYALTQGDRVHPARMTVS